MSNTNSLSVVLTQTVTSICKCYCSKSENRKSKTERKLNTIKFSNNHDVHIQFDFIEPDKS